MKRVLAKVVGSLCFLLSSYACAGIPVWTYTPLTPTTIAVGVGDFGSIRYLLTNQSNRTHILTMRFVQAVHQLTGAGYCGNPIVLGPKQSCVLDLQINGQELCFCGPIVGGPILCEQGNPNECYQPNPLNVLNIQLVE